MIVSMVSLDRKGAMLSWTPQWQKKQTSARKDKSSYCTD